jgi:hypothetical protein
MINWEYRFHANCSHLYESVGSAPSSVGTAFRIFRDPSLRPPLGSGAGPMLIAGCAGKFSASLSKNACRFGYAI